MYQEIQALVEVFFENKSVLAAAKCSNVKRQAKKMSPLHHMHSSWL